MILPYRTRRMLKRLGITALIVLLAAIIIWLCWFLWLGRYVVYTRDQGAKLDFDRSSLQIMGQEAVAPAPSEPVSIYFNEGENQLNVSRELTQLVGYYISTEDLEKDFASVRPQLQQLEKGTPVMIDVKSIQGNFYYSSSVSERRNPDIDTKAMDELLDYLRMSDFYTIARLPALRDYHYGLNNVLDGMPTAGGYLWMDDSRCYWLNPTRQGTMNYLVNIITELKSLGFDEVVLYDLRIPDTKSIVFKQDKQEAITKAAKTLVDTCATESFAVSFVGDTTFVMPEGRSRLYLENATAAEAAAMVQQTGIEDPSVYIVFLTELHDTRFDAFSVMRPLSAAH